ncbi:hypothetical protein B0H17DRAFT_1092498 [Mycena rosella]|uniref:F-box domain-containing protein n=1 Tax=Mycena rosella TaxID=1033263 RepID=A0AAD7CUM2_MYCRO|nr:hypothetical protein B0H17DRAFT_1092498 [Mycena rosella]
MSSPFASKLGTNYAPKDDEVAEIHALLVDPTRQLEHLDAEISAVRNTLDKLTEERERLGAYVAQHKALVTPVRRVPLDILQEIFVACLPTHRNCVMSAREAPVILGRICSAWRVLSLSTPRLWTSLHVVEPTWSFNALFEAKWTQRLEIAKAWLGRSGQCLLSISLEGANFAPYSPTPRPGQDRSVFLAALIPFAQRWQHISLAVAPAALETLAHLADSDVPMLQSIAIVQHHDYNYFQLLDWGRFGILGGARLSDFSVSGNNFRVAELPLRWHVLTALSLLGPTGVDHTAGGAMSSETALQLISRCPALTSCGLRLVDELATEIYMQPSIVEHSLLDSLELCCAGTGIADTFQHLLGRLSLPVLRNFTLRVYSTARLDAMSQFYAPDAIQRLSRFLASSTQLRSLDIDTATFSKELLASILPELPPTLQHLGMNDMTQHSDGWGWEPPEFTGLDDDVLDVLTSAPCGSTLKSLDIRYNSTISDLGFLRFITSMMRVRPRPTLHGVNVEFSREIQLDILPELENAIESGLEVSITYQPPIPTYFSPWHGLPDYLQVSA